MLIKLAIGYSLGFFVALSGNNSYIKDWLFMLHNEISLTDRKKFPHRELIKNPYQLMLSRKKNLII